MLKWLAIAGFLAGLLSHAATVRADAASYIRTLFDATVSASGATLACDEVAPLARFAAGRHWRGFDADARARFDSAFCALARETLHRLHRRYPDLALSIIDTHAGPSGLAWVKTEVRADGRDWPVDWQIADPQGAPYVADIRLMGVSLAILLRGLAANAAAPVPDDVLRPWRRALERALPENGAAP